MAWITKTFAIGAECMRPRSDNDALPKMTMLTPKARPDTRQVSGMIETNEENALSRACVAGRFDNAEWLLSELCGLKTVVPPAHDVRGVPTLDHVVRVVRDAFVDCAARGQRGNAEWLAERLGLCHANFARHATWALAAACGTGRLALAQWICAKFSLGGTDVRARGYLAFLKACKHGHVDIAKVPFFAKFFAFFAKILQPRKFCNFFLTMFPQVVRGQIRVRAAAVSPGAEDKVRDGGHRDRL